MPVISACPDVSVLKQLALGQMPPQEVERLAQHCEQCPRCIQVLHSLKAEDTLIEAMAAQGTAPNQSRDAVVNALIERLKRLPSPASADGEMTATVALGPTRSGDGPPAATIEQTLAGDVSLAPAQSPDEIGRLGGYRVLKILGVGGMGMVYHAEDVHLQRPIALKVMKPEVSKNPTARERFLREARAAAKLKSDHVVNIYQVGEERQVVFLAMEFLEGLSLDDWLKKGRKPTVAQAARMGRQIALGLADAHACGLIHRDIKPGNIWLDSRHQGRVKLLDFGLARGDKDDHQLTQSGAIVGTPAYMAPEQARGEHVDPRGDLFSLGVVLYRLTTGQLPFRGDNTMSVLTSLALDTPKPPREIDADIPPRMASLIERLLSKDREQRPKTAKAVADELAAIEREAAQPAADDRTVQVQAASVSERGCVSAPSVSSRGAYATPLTAPSRSRLRWLVAASLLLVLGGVAAAIVVIVHDKDGNKIAEISVPPGGKAEIKDNADAKANGPPKEEGKIAAAPLAAMLPGEALSPFAFVRQPAKLPGVRSWSIEQRNPFLPSAIAYRPDSQQIAAADVDGRIRILDAKSGRLVQLLLGQIGIRFLVWSPDGRKLAAYGKETNHQVIRIWEAESGRVLPAPEAFAGSLIDALVWSSDGHTLRAAHRSDGLLIWDAATGKLLRKIDVRGLGEPAAFSADGKRFVAVMADLRIALWDVENVKEIRKLPEFQGGTLSLACSPHGKYLAIGGAHDQVAGVRVWEVESGKEIVFRKDLFNSAALCWSPDGKAFLSAHGSQNGFCIRITKRELPAKSQTIEDSFASSIAWAPDGKTIAWTHQKGGRVCLHDVDRGKRLWSLSGEVELRSIALSADGRTLAFKGWNNESSAVLASMDTGQVLEKVKEVHAPVALSPNGKRLAVQGPNSSIWLYEDNGKVRIPLMGHNKYITWLAWSPQGKILASGSQEGKRVLLWDVEKGERLRELAPFNVNANYEPRWSPDGSLFAFRTPDRGWQIWAVEQNKLLNDPVQWNIPGLDLHPNGRLALVYSYPHSLQIKEIASAKTIAEHAMHIRGGAVWSPDGRMLAVSHTSGVDLWRGDLRRRLRTLEASNLTLVKLAFSSDGKLLLGQEVSSRLHVWETDTGRRRGIVFLGEHNNALTLAADGHYNGNEQVERGIVAVVQKDDGTQEVLEPADFEQKYGWKNDPNKVHLLQPLPPPLYPQPGQPMGANALVREPAELSDANSWTIETVNSRAPVKAVAYRPDGKLLASGGDDGTIRLWDTSSGTLVRMFICDHPVTSLSWSKDGVLAAAARGWGVSLWEVDAGQLLRRIEAGHLVAWSPDGKTLAITNDDGGMSLWDRATQRFAHGHHFPINVAGIAWSPDGKALALGLFDKTIRLWDVASWKETHKLEGHQSGHIRGLAWSPNGKRLVSAAYLEPNFYVWDAAGGKLQGSFALKNPNAGSADVGWTPDGKAVVIGRDGLLAPENGRRLRSFEGNPMVYSIAISPDGKQVARGGPTGSHLLDTASGKQTHPLEQRDDNPLSSLAWSPDSRYLALTTKDGRSSQIVDAATGRKQSLAATVGWKATAQSPDDRVRAILAGDVLRLEDAKGLPLGVLLPFDAFGQLAVTADGHYRGSSRVERAIRMVVQKRDGTTETLTLRDFEQKYKFKNDPSTVRLIQSP